MSDDIKRLLGDIDTSGLPDGPTEQPHADAAAPLTAAVLGAFGFTADPNHDPATCPRCVARREQRAKITRHNARVIATTFRLSDAERIALEAEESATDMLYEAAMMLRRQLDAAAERIAAIERRPWWRR